MIGRLAWRSLTAHPVRSAVLAAGFGVGVGVMAILLGVAEIVLEQSQSPALVGGGDVVIRVSDQVPARLLLSGTLQARQLRSRIRAAAASHTTDLYLLHDGRATRVSAQGGIPSRERAIGDPETASIAEWQDSSRDLAWTENAPEKVLRQIDRFHTIPDAPMWGQSWAEWLYFNGRAPDARFYLTFMVGPRSTDGKRTAAVRLQLERNGRMESFSTGALLTDADVAQAPDLTVAGSSVRLEGMRYVIHLDLADATGRRLTGELSLQASADHLVPPIEMTGAHGWRTGYVVPVMSGPLEGKIDVGGNRLSLKGGTGYHDHNWGFWQDVSWQWGQVQHDDLSFIYGRVFPPREAADPDRFPGFVGVLGPDGPLGYATNVRIIETNADRGRPKAIVIRARSQSLELDMTFNVASTAVSRMSQGFVGEGLEFLQMRGLYTVKGRASTRTVAFSSQGAAETFRGAFAPASTRR